VQSSNTFDYIEGDKDCVDEEEESMSATITPAEASPRCGSDKAPIQMVGVDATTSPALASFGSAKELETLQTERV